MYQKMSCWESFFHLSLSKSSLSEQADFAGIQVKKEHMTSGRRVRQEYKDVVRSCREKIRENQLAIALKKQ